MLAAIREGYIPEDQLKYLGKTDGEHTYLIDSKHVVKLDEIVDFEEINDQGETIWCIQVLSWIEKSFYKTEVWLSQVLWKIKSICAEFL